MISELLENVRMVQWYWILLWGDSVGRLERVLCGAKSDMTNKEIIIHMCKTAITFMLNTSQIIVQIAWYFSFSFYGHCAFLILCVGDYY